jgi:hypothetical protein
MAKAVLKSTYLALNGVDRSSWCSKVELTVEYDEKDATVFTSGGAKEYLAGLEGSKLAITLKNDVAASQLDETMWALRGNVVSFETRATSAAVGTSNPKYTGNVLVSSWTPISGAPGDVNEMSVTYPVSGVVTRATS